MTSDKQLAANRRNAQKSTGPTSAAGKAASSMNALKTGIHAQSAIIPGEKARDLQQLIDEYYSAYQPATPAARDLVDDLIRSAWTLRRLDTSEASLWHYQNDSIRPIPPSHQQGRIVAQNMKAMTALQRRVDSTRRGRDRALDALRELDRHPLPTLPPQPEAAPDPVTPRPSATSSQNGFVPPISPTPSRPPAPAASEAVDSPRELPHILHI